MKPLCVLLGSFALVLYGFAQQNSSASSAAASEGKAQLRAELRSLAAVAQKITTAASREEKARGWIELNRQAKKFGEEMNAAFPDTSINGDAILPAEAQHLALTATSYGVRIAFCESGGNWQLTIRATSNISSYGRMALKLMRQPGWDRLGMHPSVAIPKAQQRNSTSSSRSESNSCKSFRTVVSLRKQNRT